MSRILLCIILLALVSISVQAVTESDYILHNEQVEDYSLPIGRIIITILTLALVAFIMWLNT